MKASSPNDKSSPLKIVWWNVASLLIEPENTWSSLEHFQKKADVLLLAESTVEEHRNIAKKMSWTYHEFVPYQPQVRGGISVFSKHPLLEMELETLELYDESWSPEKKRTFLKEWQFVQNYSWMERPLVLFKIQKNQRVYTLATTHLTNIWRAWIDAMKAHYTKKGWPPLVQNIWIGFRIWSHMNWGLNNPLGFQVKNLKSSLQKKKDYLLIGDFNTPDVLPPSPLLRPLFATRLYRLLRQGHKEVLASRATLRSIASQAKPELMVDHAFTHGNQWVAQGRVIKAPYGGSDHHPIEIKFSPAPSF